MTLYISQNSYVGAEGVETLSEVFIASGDRIDVSENAGARSGEHGDENDDCGP